MKTIKENIFDLSISYFGLRQSFKNQFLRFQNKKNKKFKIGFLVEEFFHKELRGFGGYGMTVKNLTDAFNMSSNGISTEVLLTSMLEHHEVGIKHYHNAEVLFRPGHAQQYVKNFMKYGRMANHRNLDALISIDWYKSYEYTAKALPKTPLIIWIKDPRAKKEWERILNVPLALEVIGDQCKGENLNIILDRKRNSVQEILHLSKKFNRKIIFATQAHCLVEKAQRAYGLDKIEAIFLPNIFEPVDITSPKFSKKPSVCFLGRLEPVKRPWIFLELAKHFPNVDFLVAGIAHFPALLNPILDKYKSLPNVKFLGLVSGEEKHDLLNSAWAIMNTSIHEALPVSFLEAFSYGKPVISCQDPDEFVSQFGYATGEVLGEGLGEKDIELFSKSLEQCLSNEKERLQKGKDARACVLERYSFESHQQALSKALNK